MTAKELYDKVGGNYNEIFEMFMSDDLIQKFLFRFQESSGYEQLVEAVEKGDIEASFLAAHTLKGTSANMRLNTLAGAVSKLTEQLRPKTEVADIKLFEEVKKQYEIVNNSINELS